jgi:hypothetical protein
MSLFFDLLDETDKLDALGAAVQEYRTGRRVASLHERNLADLKHVPYGTYCYWLPSAVIKKFEELPRLDGELWQAKAGTTSGDDFRFGRLWFEVSGADRWVDYAKGGPFSPFHVDVSMKINWKNDAKELKTLPSAYIRNEHYYFRPGLSWPIKNRFSFKARILPADCVFSHVSSSIFHSDDDRESLLALLALTSSKVFSFLIQSISGWNFEVGSVQNTPLPSSLGEHKKPLARLAERGWRIARYRDTINENSRSFVLPQGLLRKKPAEDFFAKHQADLERVLSEIDEIAWIVYDTPEVSIPVRRAAVGQTESIDTDEIDDDAVTFAVEDGLLSWAIGVAFSRFDWRLATGEREYPQEPNPFDPLPVQSPGMLPDGAEPFHAHSGILVDDQGHPNDLARLIEEVLARVDAPIHSDVRRWLQRDFFPLHFRQYSKSRRKAPIYWPLSTTSGSYTLWIYYPSLTSETLYTAVNDFVEPKLEEVRQDLASHQAKGNRSRDEDRRLEALVDLEGELLDLRAELLRLAPDYKPNHDDGVQITAAPLWRLFRHKPWSKLLRETWDKLEKGDYDWAHLAMAYWPDRVREKCRTDKSLAIAHDLEHLYQPPPETAGGKKRKQKGSEA